MELPRILVITSCTGEKCFRNRKNQLVLNDFQDPKRLKSREKSLSRFVCQAKDLYTGVQHLRLLEGIQLLRQSYGDKVVDVKILSAGYGLIDESRKIYPYEVSFNGMKTSEIDNWSEALAIHDSVETAIRDYDLVFFLLGDNYIRSIPSRS